MGKSHYKSHIIGKTGAENIASVNNITALGTLTVPKISATTSLSVPAVAASSYIRIGTKKVIFSTDYSMAASINAQATLLAKSLSFAASVVKGSAALGAGELWMFTSANTATMVTVP